MAKRRKTMSAKRFALGMLVYALAFLVIVVAGLRVFWDIMADYEDSRPGYTVDAYAASFDEAHIRRLAQPFVEDLNHALVSEEEAYSHIIDLFDGNLKCAKKSGESTEDKLVYAITNDGRLLVTATITKGEEIDGVTQWYIADEKVDFSDLLRSSSFTVPSEWKVTFNGEEVGSEYVVEENIKYSSLKDFYDEGFPVPYMTRYAFDNYIGEPEITVTDWNGNEIAVSDGTAEVALTDNCSQSDKERVTKFSDEFLELYIAFMSCSNRDPYGNYSRLAPYMLKNSDIDKRVYGAIEGLTWAQSRGDLLHDVQHNSIIRLGEGYFLADVSYKIDTTGGNGVVTTDGFVNIIIQDTADGLKVIKVYTY